MEILQIKGVNKKKLEKIVKELTEKLFSELIEENKKQLAEKGITKIKFTPTSNSFEIKNLIIDDVKYNTITFDKYNNLRDFKFPKKYSFQDLQKLTFVISKFFDQGKLIYKNRIANHIKLEYLRKFSITKQQKSFFLNVIKEYQVDYSLKKSEK
jgi:hypothetical protein